MRTGNIDNHELLLQDCNRPLFRWFLGRIDWKRILKEMTWEEHMIEQWEHIRELEKL